jgi:D-3-phosphoglycerate dehydrogenase
MKILIADKFEKVGIDGLKELGCTVVSLPDLTAEALPVALKEHDPNVLIVRSTKVNGEALRSGTSLGLVIRAGAGSTPSMSMLHPISASSSPTVRGGTRSRSPSW